MARDVRTRDQRRRAQTPEPPYDTAPDTGRAADDPLAGDVVDERELEVVDRQGNRWALRPIPRGQYDYMGFGVFWWAVFWLVIIGLLVWWAWGY